MCSQSARLSWKSHISYLTSHGVPVASVACCGLGKPSVLENQSSFRLQLHAMILFLDLSCRKQPRSPCNNGTTIYNMTDSPSTPHIAHTLLSRAHPPSTADTIFATKVIQRPLHLRPTSPDPTSQDARSQRRLLRLRKSAHKARKQKPRPLSAKEKRILGVYDIPASAQKYDLYVPLHKLWVGYMWEILGLKEGEPSGGYVTAQGQGAKLASADFHGAEVQVVRSRCVGRVGCQGIVVKDTKFTFEVITKKDELKSEHS